MTHAALFTGSRGLDHPHRLTANQNLSFQGSVVVGLGFTLTPEQAESLISEDLRNKDVIMPYINGRDLNSSPTLSPSRWIINFFDWPLEKAETYVEPMAIVRTQVKPQRDNVRRKAHRQYWWHYGDKRPALYEAISSLRRILVVGQTGKYHSFTFLPPGMVYDQKLIIFASQSYSFFALLQSTLHVEWALKRGSTLKRDPVYTPSNCFETFPFPPVTAEQRQHLDRIGETYHAYRQEIMLARREGLTEAYNRFHDVDDIETNITELRDLHVEMDQAVAATYGWQDLDLEHGFHETQQGLRFTISERARREVLTRLLELNHERYAEEVRQGLHEEKEKKGARKGAKAQTEEKDKRQMSLF